MSRIQRDYSKRTWPCAMSNSSDGAPVLTGVAATTLQLTTAEGKMLAGNLATYAHLLAKREPSTPPPQSRDRIEDFRTLTQAAVDAVICGLAAGEARGKQPGEWRGKATRRTLLHHAADHIRYQMFPPTVDEDHEDHLVHAITDAVMAYALREGK